jgi:hypothetical protein
MVRKGRKSKTRGIDMFYAIDFDSLTVESKSEQGEGIADYILENDLSLAVALIDSSDELCLQFSLNEMNDLHKNICETDVDLIDDEELLADVVWEILEESKDNFPEFSPKLAKKLLKQSPEAKVTKPKPKTNSPTKAKDSPSRTRVNLDLDSSLTIVEGKCKKGSILHTIVLAVEEELCDTVGEVLDYIVNNHIIPKTGELADMKFAEHNVKYFIKQGKINAEEEL